MKNSFTFSLTLAVLVCFALAACNKNSTAAPFKNQATWDLSKQQRWSQFQQEMSTEATALMEQDQNRAAYHVKYDHLDAAGLQSFADAVEQRRTGDTTAKSCRRVINTTKGYDFSHCSQGQLAAELFQEYEEAHHR